MRINCFFVNYKYSFTAYGKSYSQKLTQRKIRNISTQFFQVSTTFIITRAFTLIKFPSAERKLNK